MTETNEYTLIERIRHLSVPLEPFPTETPAQLIRLADVQVILFDMYGTLFVSGTGDISLAREMSNAQALTEALRCAGLTGQLDTAGERGCDLLLEAIQQSHTARRQEGVEAPEVDIRQEWRKVVRQLQRETLLCVGEIEKATLERLSIEYECRVNPVWPMPDVLDTLAWLRDQNLAIGIVSNAQFYTQLLFPALLDYSHLELGFQPELCSWSFEWQEAKPSPRLFSEILATLQQQHIAPHQVAYVGNDMLNDVWPASQLGLRTVLFAGDRRSLRLRQDDMRCGQIEPDAIITSLAQLTNMLTPSR